MTAALLMSSCGAAAHHTATDPTTTVVATDHWNPPSTAGPPSASKFCALLVADYEHIAQLDVPPSLVVRKEIAHDFVSFTPSVIAAAPPTIASAAKTYLTAIAQTVEELRAADLNPQKLPKGALGQLIVPSIQSAGDQVISFSNQSCHYSIGGA
jgi:hypothetical protein